MVTPTPSGKCGVGSSTPSGKCGFMQIWGPEKYAAIFLLMGLGMSGCHDRQPTPAVSEKSDERVTQPEKSEPSADCQTLECYNNRAHRRNFEQLVEQLEEEDALP